MKYLIVLVVVLAGVWLWRHSRQSDKRDKREREAARPAPKQLQDMVRCPVCSVHLPQGEAVAGRLAYYCCAEHRQRAEG